LLAFEFRQSMEGFAVAPLASIVGSRCFANEGHAEAFARNQSSACTLAGEDWQPDDATGETVVSFLPSATALELSQQGAAFHLPHHR
jgi:hypothetical protein